MKVCETIVHEVEETRTETTKKFIKEAKTFCRDLPWPLDVLCSVVVTIIEIFETIVYTILRVWTEVVCRTIEIVLLILASVYNTILLIPVLGTWVKALVGLIVFVWSQLVGALDAGLGLLGIRPIKHLRLYVVVLMRRDRTLTVPLDRIDLALARTKQIFRERADVKIVSTVFAVDTPSPSDALQIESGIGLLLEDMGPAGFYFQKYMTEKFWTDGPLFVWKVGAPLVAFVTEGVGSSETGCSAGPLADYICIEGGQMIVWPQSTPVTAATPPQPPNARVEDAAATLAHEIGHACGLPHVDDATNLMSPSSNDNFNPSTGARINPRGTNLSPLQRAIVRSSPHVTYL